MILLGACAGLVGCASPGPPLPPSLKLPEIVAGPGLTAMRVGDAVQLHWKTPARTTDKLLIHGPVTALICRDEVSAAGLAAAKSAAKAAVPACTAATRLTVAADAPADAVDLLPASLAAGPARLLAYRVELLNSAGRTAGPSAAVYALAGAAPGPVADLHGKATKAGVVLEWRAAAGGADGVELERTLMDAPAPAAAGAGKPSPDAASAGKGGLPNLLGGAMKAPAVERLRTGAADAGGTIDRTAEMGHTYRYVAQRVRSVVAGRQTLEARGAVSEPVTVVVEDVFPPDAPVGLVAVPGFAGEGESAKPAIDLSWEPDLEPRMAGYRVYRREVDSGGAARTWVRLGEELVTAAAYRDPTVVAGHRYAYRVTAENEKGNESSPSAEAAETAPGP